MAMKSLSKVSAFTAWLSRPSIPFWTLPWLMVLLVAGTVAQKYVGLYIAQKTFFSSFIFWFGPIPLPGGYTVTAIIFVALLAKVITQSRWSWPRAGIILTHLGVLVLLAGGLLTAVTAREAFIVIDEGAESSLVEDYHARVLSITKDGDEIASIPQDRLHEGMLLGMEHNLPFNIHIRSLMVNGTPQPRKDLNGENWRGPGAKVEMIPAKPDMQNENNHGAVTIEARGTGKDTDGLYLMTEVMPLYPQFDVKDSVYELRFRKATSDLPFTLALSDVEKDNYPGMDMARAYRSTLTIKDGETTWPAEISMNNPLRYRGYTFYQSSYMINENGKEATVLSVVWNVGRLFPYIASAIIAVGLILHLLISTRGRRAAVLVLGILCLHQTPALATDLDMHDFRMIPVLHEGRLKPLETFAETELRAFSGKISIDNLSADQWLAELLFDPVRAAERPIFQVRNRDVQLALGLPHVPGALYTLSQITKPLNAQAERLHVLAQTPVDKLEARQKDLLELHHKVTAYMQLMRSFSLVLPLAVTPPDSLLTEKERQSLSGQTPDYLTLRKFEERASKRLKQIIAKRGDDPAKYNAEEQAIALFAWQLETLSGSSADNRLFRVIPVDWDHEERLSPWAVLQEGKGSPATAALIAQWRTLGLAWLNEDATAWQKAAHELRGENRTVKFTAERLYNHINPFQCALLLYALTIIALIVFIRTPSVLAYNFAMASLLLGAVIHAAGIALRVYILSRPPVGTLYESLLFVSLVCVLVGTLLFWKRRDGFSGLAAAFSGLLVLCISLYFGAQSGDTLSMLVAVLNTNFWLATHVLIVTAGYGFAIVAAMLAHAWLFAKNDRSGLFATMHRVGLAALLFTAVGTILGGIWADQSWGRFWGWDPKENGALLIVLWITWLLHGRMGGHLSQPLYAVGIASLNMVVALAWFGVNLLSVGLHSYGFISGIATGLATFCAFECALIAFLYGRRRHA
jgi:ABC-type transport system involved in cytochrome c biogenesis permease subunit